MKSIFKFGWTLLFALRISMPSPAQTPQNLVAGVGPLTNSLAAVGGFSVIDLISGNTLFSASGKQTFLNVGFTQSDRAEVTMVLYTTRRNNTVIENVTPITFGGISSGVILFGSACGVPASTVHPCVIQLDPLPFKLVPTNDYYFVTYFPSDSVNFPVDIASALNSRTTIIGGLDANNDTTLAVGNVIPSTLVTGTASFLVGVTSQ